MSKPSIAHLSPESRAFFQRIVRRYRLLDQHRKLLTLICEAFDRGAEAREIVKREGLVTGTARGGQRRHPALAIEHDATIRAARLLRELGLSDEVEAPRPPRPSGRYRR